MKSRSNGKETPGDGKYFTLYFTRQGAAGVPVIVTWSTISPEGTRAPFGVTTPVWSDQRDNRLVDIEREHDRWTVIESCHWYVRARLRLSTAEEGGRKTPIASGYRSHWTFPPEVHDEGHDAPLTMEAGPSLWLKPGEEAIVRLHPLVPALWPALEPGLRLTMREGARVVGLAEVIERVDPEA